MRKFEELDMCKEAVLVIPKGVVLKGRRKERELAGPASIKGLKNGDSLLGYCSEGSG